MPHNCRICTAKQLQGINIYSSKYIHDYVRGRYEALLPSSDKQIEKHPNEKKSFGCFFLFSQLLVWPVSFAS